MARSIETILGTAGGILGIAAGLAVALVGGIGEAFVQIPGATDLYTRAALTIFAALVGIVAALSAPSKGKISGIMMMVAAVLGAIGAGVFYFLPAASLGIAGIVAFVKKAKVSDAFSSTQCPNCGAPVEPFAKFCVKCDSPVQTASAT